MIGTDIPEPKAVVKVDKRRRRLVVIRLRGKGKGVVRLPISNVVVDALLAAGIPELERDSDS